VSEIIVLYDLQNALRYEEIGEFFGDSFLIPCGESSKLSIVEIEDVKTIFISNRATDDDGLAILTPDFGKYVPGDRVTITGRVDENAHVGGWSLELHRCHPDGTSRLVQQYFPEHDRMYALSYVLDKKDIERHIRLVSRPWMYGVTPADFYVDEILITRAREDFLKDLRDVIYIMENDRHLKELNGGGYTEFLFATGDPLYSFYENEENGSVSIHLSRRANDWDGIDIRLSLMNLLRDNKYCIKVTGRIDGTAPSGSEITLQLLPSYAWRGTQTVTDNQEFTLTHTLSPDELETIESVRITTNSIGANMPFYVHEIEVFVGN